MNERQILCALLLGGSTAAAQTALTPVIWMGDTAAGLPPGYVYNGYFGGPGIGPGGDVLVSARMHLNNQSDIDAVLIGPPGSLRAAALSGTQPPGMPAGAFFTNSSGSPFFLCQVRAGGVPSFGGRVAGGGTTSANNQGFWREESGQLTMRLRTGDAAPGTPAGVTFASFNGAAFADSGEVVARGQLTGPGVTAANAPGIWSGPHGGLQLLARQGDQAVGLPAGTTYRNVVDEPTINSSGTVAFHARTIDSQSVVGDGIWTGKPGNLRLAASTGDAAPGFPAGSTLSDMQPASINRQGAAFFAAYVQSPAAGPGLFVNDLAGTRVIARKGGAVPGFGAAAAMDMVLSTEIVSYAYPFQVGDNSNALFYATLTGTAFPIGGFGLFTGDGTRTTLIALKNGQAPGLPTGVLFNTLLGSSMNDVGQVVFSARAGGNNDDLWAFDGVNTRRLLAVGQQVQVGPGIFKTISSIIVGTGSNAASFGAPPLNNNGTVTAFLAFTDQSAGVFTTAIPGPAGSSLLVCGLVVCSRRRR